MVILLFADGTSSLALGPGDESDDFLASGLSLAATGDRRRGDRRA
jgi:hypothetical protein